MSSMSAKMVGSFFQSKELKFEYDGDNDEIIRINFNADNLESIRISLFFTDEDDENVALRVFNLAKVDDAKKPKVYEACSKLNDDYRWVKFCVDEQDNTVTAAIDAIIRMDIVGEICYELVMRTVNIVDESYPILMKALWA